MAVPLGINFRFLAQKCARIFLSQPMSSKVKHKLNFHNSSFLYAVGQEIRMPSLSPTMVEGTIVKWLKKEGDTIMPGDVLCDIQTDKAVVSFDTDEEGILAKILAPENSKDVKIGTLIGLMVSPGEDWQKVEMPHTADSAEGVSSPGGQDGGAGGGHSNLEKASPSFKTSTLMSYGPVVRNLLARYDLKSSQMIPTGYRNKLLKDDVLKYIEKYKLIEKAPKSVPPPVQVISVKPQPTKTTRLEVSIPASYVELEISNTRKTIAKRLTESKTQIPHAYATVQCNIDEVLKMKKRYKDDGRGLSVNDFIIKAVALGLRHCPGVNACWIDEEAVRVRDIDISVAVATDAGLITPIVKSAADKTLLEISEVVKDLTLRARQGKLQLHEFQGGSFTISNLGMFGVKEFNAIINPPQCGILAVGGGHQVLDGEGKPLTTMMMTLSYDRRAIDDTVACEFLNIVQNIIEYTRMY